VIVERETGCEVIGEADNGSAAMQMIDRLRPDIAVLEYQLSGPNGLHLTRHVAKNHPQCQILIFTQNEEEDLIRDLLEAGARAFVRKSDPEADLIAALRALMKRQPYFSSLVSEALLSAFLLDNSALRPQLTEREREIVQMIASGQSNKRIASRLDLAVKTVESHRASAMRKLDVHTSADLTRYAIRNRLVSP
jgi:DNA-binding NarL/FixJ family response regulator